MAYGDLDYHHIVQDDQYWRIVSALFLHNGMNHLVNNLFLLIFLGAMIEKKVGHFIYLAVYLVSGIGGNVLSLLAKGLMRNPPPSVGASGAIFGLVGVLLALLLFSRRKIEDVTPLRVILVIAFMIYSGYTSPQIDNVGHIGGVVTGFVLGIGVSVKLRYDVKGNDARREDE
jgi:rhomboid protease GluP